MDFKLEAEPEELREKGPALIALLAKSFAEVDPELAERLEKALPAKEPELKHRVLRDIHAKTRAAYEDHTKRMLADIDRVLAHGTAEPIQKSATPGEDMWDGLVGLLRRTSGETMEKGTGEAAVAAIAEKDEHAYNTIREGLYRMGYTPDDFDSPDGVFYGKSTNELIDVALRLLEPGDG